MQGLKKYMLQHYALERDIDKIWGQEVVTMEVRNCVDCGKMFNYMGGTPLCAACAKKLEDKFEIVKEYVYDNPRATINEVAEENEVSVRQIKRWIKEERLAFSDDSPIGIECEGCGKTIRTGRYCEMCKKSLGKQLGVMYQKSEVQVQKLRRDSDAKMRFLK